MSENSNNARGKNFDVFISYRRSDGTDKAKQLDLAFSIDDCRTFFDFKSLGTGAFDKRLENAVLDAPIFIMVWTPDYFKRCVKGGETADGKTVLEPDEDDWVRKEIELALKHNKKIIPINFNHVLDKVPDYLDDEFRNKISPHNYVNLYGDNTFDATVKDIFEKEIRPFIGITPRPENKVKVRVKADADCELISDDEVIATIQQGKTAQLFFEKGEYEITARSIEFSDIDNVIERTFDNVSFNYLIKTELAYRVKQRQIEIEEEEKKKKEEEERIRREEEERRRGEEEERIRREEEKRLEERRKKEEEQRRKEEQARLEAERQRQEYLRKEEQARKQREQERERQRREAEERRKEEQKRNKKNEKKDKDSEEQETWLVKNVLLISSVIICPIMYAIGYFNPNLDTWVVVLISIGAIFVISVILLTIYDILKAKKDKKNNYDETRLPEIYSIEIRNEPLKGYPITDYGETIYSSETMYLCPRIRYKSYADREYKFDIKWIKPDGSIRRRSSSPAGYTLSNSYSLSYGEGYKSLHGWGYDTKGDWKAGRYAIEIWCEGTLLKREELTIY